MNIVYFLLPAALLLALIFVLMFLWANKRRQFDDLESPAQRMLLDSNSVKPQDSRRAETSPDRSTKNPEKT